MGRSDPSHSGCSNYRVAGFVFRASRLFCMCLHFTKRIALTSREQWNLQQVLLIAGLRNKLRRNRRWSAGVRASAGRVLLTPGNTAFLHCSKAYPRGHIVHSSLHSRRIVTPTPSLYFSWPFTHNLATLSARLRFDLKAVRIA